MPKETNEREKKWKEIRKRTNRKHKNSTVCAKREKEKKSSEKCTQKRFTKRKCRMTHSRRVHVAAAAAASSSSFFRSFSKTCVYISRCRSRRAMELSTFHTFWLCMFVVQIDCNGIFRWMDYVLMHISIHHRFLAHAVWVTWKRMMIRLSQIHLDLSWLWCSIEHWTNEAKRKTDAFVDEWIQAKNERKIIIRWIISKIVQQVHDITNKRQLILSNRAIYFISVYLTTKSSSRTHMMLEIVLDS